MKRRVARSPARSFDPLSAELARATEAIVAAACEDVQIAERLDRGDLRSSSLVRQALTLSLREAYRIVERSRQAPDSETIDDGFPSVASATPDLDSLDVANLLSRVDRERLETALLGLADIELGDDVLGEALAKLSTTPFVRRSPLRDFERQRVREAGGAFFTPPELVERLLDLTLEPLLDERTRHKSVVQREAELLDLAIVDPACGSGRFLLAAAQRIARRLVEVRREGGAADASETQARADVVERCLWGVDVEPAAIEALRFRLRRELRKAGRPATAIVHRTLCGDATREIDWNAIANERPSPEPGFDAILGNPPWISFSGRHRGSASAGQVAQLVERFPEVASWPALHSATLALAARHARPGGRVGLVLPLRVADLDAYADLRKAVGARLRLVGPVVDAGEEAFAGVVQPTGLFAFRALDEPCEGSGASWPIEAATCAPGRSSIGRTDDARVEELLRYAAAAPAFPPGVFGDPGVHTGNVARKLIVDDSSEGLPLLREGRDVSPFRCGAPRRSLRPSIELADGEYCRVGRLERYLATPVLLRQTADRPIAARHVERTYFRNSVLSCAGLPGISDEIVVAFLNSALYALLHRRASGDARQRTFPQVKVSALQRLPLPPIGGRSRDLMQSIAERVKYAETVVASSQGAPDDLSLDIERLVLRAFGADEDLAPRLLDLAGPFRAAGRR